MEPLLKKKRVAKLKRVHRIVNEMVLRLKEFGFTERLLRLNLQTLEERRKGSDMIMLYKCVNGLDGKDGDEFITSAV